MLKPLKIFLLLLLCFISVSSKSQTWKWFDHGNMRNPYGGTYTIRTDSLANIYIMGSSNDSISMFGISHYASNYESFLFKLDSSGALIWYKFFHSSNNVLLYDLEVTADGTCYLSGNFGGSLQIDSESLVCQGQDPLLIKISPSGVCAWMKEYHGSQNGTGFANDLVLDENERIYLCGWSTVNPVSSGTWIYDAAFVTCVDSSGTALWFNQYDMTLPSGSWCGGCFTFYSIALDNNKNVYVSGSMSFNDSTAYAVLEGDTLSHQESLVSSYDQNGNHRFTNHNNTGYAFTNSIAPLPNGNIVSSTAYYDSIFVNGAWYYSQMTCNNILQFMDTTGAVYGVYNISGNGTQRVSKMTADTSGNIIISAYYDDTLICNGLQVPPVDSGYDILLFSLNPATNQVNWYYSFGGKDRDMLSDVYTDDDNHLFICGSTISDTCDFNTTAVVKQGALALFWGEMEMPLSTTSLDVLTNDKDVVVYPNPSFGSFYVGSNRKDIDALQIEIYTLQGVKIKEGRLHAGEQKSMVINTPGTYLVRCMIDGNTAVIKKLVIIN